jgi:hypothetical protein
MKSLLRKLRNWALIKLAAGKPVAINLKLTRGLYLQAGPNDGFYENIRIDNKAEYPKVPDQTVIYISAKREAASA